jgi:hypothetical protein
MTGDLDLTEALSLRACAGAQVQMQGAGLESGGLCYVIYLEARAGVRKFV